MSNKRHSEDELRNLNETVAGMSKPLLGQCEKPATDKVGVIKIGAYADGKYMGKCSNCGKEFTGDKRATSCLKCAIALNKQEVEELKAENDKLKSFQGYANYVRLCIGDDEQPFGYHKWLRLIDQDTMETLNNYEVEGDIVPSHARKVDVVFDALNFLPACKKGGLCPTDTATYHIKALCEENERLKDKLNAKDAEILMFRRSTVETTARLKALCEELGKRGADDD